MPGDTVLLAPAAQSFDMFRDYPARGDAFAAAVAAAGGVAVSPDWASEPADRPRQAARQDGTRAGPEPA